MYNYVLNNVLDLSRNAITYYGRHITYGELFSYIDKFALFLNSKGLKKGDTIAICLPNIPDAIIAIYAANKLGIICNVIHPLMPEDKILETYEVTSSKFLIISDIKYVKGIELYRNKNINAIISTIDEFMPGYLKKLYRLKNKINFETASELRFVDCIKKVCLQKNINIRFNGEEIAVYLHSGGTTGIPKTVMLSNKALNSLAYNTGLVIGGETDKDDSFLMVLPLFHGFGLGVCMHTVLSKSTNVVLIPKFNAKSTIKTIIKENVNYLAGVPAMYSKLLNEKKFHSKKVLQNFKFMFCGGDKLKEKLKKEMDNALISANSTARLNEGYGLTETVTVCTLNRKDNERFPSVGQALEGIELAIIDENLKVLNCYEKGEIIVAGDTLMNGYYMDEENTRKVFIDLNGKRWIRTGDYGYLDEDKFLYFIDRYKRMVKISGYNVFPSEIEEVVLSLDEIKNCVVITKEDEKGNYFRLLAVPDSDNADLLELKEKILKVCKEKLMVYSIPREIKIVKDLPLTAIGKIDTKSKS